MTRIKNAQLRQSASQADSIKTYNIEMFEDPLLTDVSAVVQKNLPSLLSVTGAAYVNPKVFIWDMPHTIIYGKSVYNNRLLLERILLTHVYGNSALPKSSEAVFESRSLKDISLTYTSFPRHIEFVLDNTMTVNERECFIEMLYSFTQSKSITGLPKNVIVLHGLEAIHNKHDYALRKLIEGIQSHALILMDVESLSRVIDPIKSRCNCISSKMCFDSIVDDLAATSNKDVVDVKLVLAQDTCHDVVNVALRLKIPNGHLYVGHVKSWSKTRLNELHNAYIVALQPKATSKAIAGYTSLLRETSQQLIQTGIAVSTWFKYVIDIYCDDENVDIHEIVALAAQKEALHKTKDALVLDAFIHELMFHICS